MKKLKVQLWLFFLICNCGIMEANLVSNDITGNPVFGCQWSGGSIDSGVTCICTSNAPELFIQKGSIPSYDAQIIHIDNCDTVRFGNNAINNMRNLRNVQLSNISKLYFDDSSLSWNAYVQSNNEYHNSWDNVPTLKITIENCKIQQIASYTFQGQISSIVIKDSVIENIYPFAFSSLRQNRKIEISGVNLKYIQAQAFKKFPMETLILSTSTFQELPSRTFSDVTVLDSFYINNCSFKTIRSGAFLIQSPRYFELGDSFVNKLEGESFKVVMRGSVKIKNNVFNITNNGAFLGINLNKEEVLTHEEILFDSNTFQHVEKRSFNVNSTSFTAKYINILINQQCDCNYMENIIQYEEFQCLFDTDKKMTFKEFMEYNCSILASYSTIIIIVGVMLLLFIIIASGLVYYFKRIYKKHSEYITDKNGKPVSLIMPDGRTYRETELHVVVERADLLTTDL